MRVAVSGTTGLVGQVLGERLERDGHEMLNMVRRAPANDSEMQWDAIDGTIEAAKFDGCDAVVHLAGENIATGRWTAAKKSLIRQSREQGTQIVSKALASLSKAPRVFIAASAIGYYGDRGDELCLETSLPGEGFLSDVCVDWERATQPAVDAGLRVVNLRIGVVLSRKGGALKSMLPPFQFGVGGRIGHGQQYWSWITLDDLVGVIMHCLADDSLSGPVNAVAPQPVTNQQFTKSLGRQLRRPTCLPMPALAARIVLGEMANALILASTRVEPERLKESGYTFQHTTIDEAFQHLFSR